MAIADTSAPKSSPICCFIGVAPTRNPVFKSCDTSPAIAAMTQIMEPIVIAATIPLLSPFPVFRRIIVAINSVAIAIPDTGLLLLPTSPTILEETVAKKKPKTTIMSAPSRFTGIIGSSHIKTAIAPVPRSTKAMGRSISSLEVPLALKLKPFTALWKVLTINGKDFIRLITPPASTAPAPMYLI